MLQRVSLGNGIVIYRSPILHRIGVPHAFSTRIGGVSAGPFASMNLGNPNGAPIQDDPANVRENYRMFMAAAGCGDRQLRRAHQIHGRQVLWADSRVDPPNDPKGDALATEDPHCAVSVRTADCIPILIASTDGKLVAAVHAGWRGVACNVVAAAVEQLRSRKSGVELAAAIGPAIGFDAFEAGPEVIAEFRRVFAEQIPIRQAANGKGFVDLRAGVRQQLLDLSIPVELIDTTDRCTYRDRDEFFSHRRENGITGRMCAVIGPI